MVLNAWKGHLLTRRQREQLYVWSTQGRQWVSDQEISEFSAGWSDIGDGIAEFLL